MSGRASNPTTLDVHSASAANVHRGLFFDEDDSSRKNGVVRRYFAVAVVVTVALTSAALFQIRFSTALAQTTATSDTSIRPNQGAIIGGPGATNSPAPRVALDCQGCHGPGRTLPYLAGSLFHTGPHADYDHSFHAKAITNGSKAATCLDCHAKNRDLTTILPATDSRSTINRANIADTCGRCHGDKSVMQGSGISNRPLLSYRESVHAQAIARGNMSAAVCTDCHNSHNIEPAANSTSSIAKANIPSTCGKCHSTESTEFMQSIHGQAVARGVSRSPACTDCHGIHKILVPVDHGTKTPTTAVGTESCAKCHEGVALTQEFGVAGERVSSYKDSYHGLASQLGSKVVANCASCHGVHKILPSSDPASMIHKGNLVHTCGKCHPGATEKFAESKIHVDATAASIGEGLGEKINWWVRRIYLTLIVGVIGLMLLHNALAFAKKLRARYRAADLSVLRMNLSQRLQHMVLGLSFIVLAVTGFALKFPESWLAKLLGSNEPFRRWTHRIAGVVLLALGAYHLIYLFASKDGRKLFKDLLPSKKDFKDVGENARYLSGLNARRPKFMRFNYGEKIEYWAVVWGTIIMGVTGLMIWFKMDFTRFFPRWLVDVALTIHYYEAILACLAIMIWHFYSVIFDPDVYPLNWACWKGKVSKQWHEEEHPLEQAPTVGVTAAPPESRAAEPTPQSDLVEI